MRLIAVTVSMLALLASPAVSASWLEQKLKEVDRSLCQSSAGIKCKAKGKRQARRVKTVKPLQQAAAEPPPVEEAQTVPPPKPRMKPKADSVTVIAKSPPPVEPVEMKATQEDTAEPLVIPKPRAKPAAMARVVVAAVPSKLPAPNSPVTGGDCPAQLASMQVSFDLVTERVSSGACEVRNPVQLKSQLVGGQSVAFPDKPTLNCAFALRFAGWMRDRGMPLAQKQAGSAVARFYTGPGYQCRGRNGARGGKISEHGFGNAIDIERMQLDNGKVIMVGSGNQQAVQAMRKSACEYFTTVLGPGANAAHEKHLHFDLGKHGRSDTYRICE